MKLKIVIIFLFFCFNLYASDNKELIKPLYSFFPKVSEMEGGDSRWLTTDINETINKDYILLKRSYSSFNKNPEKIWQIQRKKSFKVDVEIYYAKNFIVAKSIYKKKISKKIKYKKKVGFGDIGMMMIQPDKYHYPDADYELVFLDKNFVISLKSIDGFALMDFADYVERALSKYILNNFDRFFIKKLNISVNAFEYGIKSEEIDFVAENIKEIVVEGNVYNENNKPIAFADVEIKDFKLNTKTDEDGFYRFVLKFNGKKKLKLYKNFFLNLSVENTELINTDIYNFNIKYNMDSLKQEELYLKIRRIKDEYFVLIKDKNTINKALKFRKKDNKIHFIRDCSGNSAFRCIQIFDGEIKNSEIQGKWKGSGGGGKWNAKLLPIATKEILIKGKNCIINTVKLDKDNNLLNKTNKLIVSYDTKGKNYIELSCKFDKSDYFFNDKIQLSLTHLTSNTKKSNIIFLYFVNNKDKKYKFIQSNKIAKLSYSEEPYKVKIDITEFVGQKGTYKFLIGLPFEYDENIVHKFANSFNYSLIRPKIIFSDFVEKIQNKKMLAKFISLKSKKDYASNTNKIRPDGKKDLHLKIYNFNKSGVISYIEIKNTGDFEFRWNTDKNDIYPGIAVRKNNKIYTDKMNRFKINVAKGENLDIFLFKPDELNLNNIKLSYKIKINNEWITGNIK